MRYLAIDIGGTYIKYGLVSKSGEISFTGKVSTCKSNLDDFVNQLSAIIEPFNNMSPELLGIALSIPAPVDSITGEIKGKGSLPFLLDQSLSQILETLHEIPVSSENDGNCAALAEVWLGGAKDCEDVALVVCGTGIGGAIVKSRQIHTGKHLFAGEFGYAILDVSDRNQLKSWSHTASTKAMIERYCELKAVTQISGEELFKLAEQGDQVAHQVIEDFFFYNAIGIHSIQFYYDPELILLGGAISERPDFIEKLEQKLDEIYSKFDHGGIRPLLKRCEFSNHSNLLGAVYHFIHHKDLQ